jgi:hypothetical protein
LRRLMAIGAQAASEPAPASKVSAPVDESRQWRNPRLLHRSESTLSRRARSESRISRMTRIRAGPDDPGRVRPIPGGTTPRIRPDPAATRRNSMPTCMPACQIPKSPRLCAIPLHTGCLHFAILGGGGALECRVFSPQVRAAPGIKIFPVRPFFSTSRLESGPIAPIETVDRIVRGGQCSTQFGIPAGFHGRYRGSGAPRGEDGARGLAPRRRPRRDSGPLLGGVRLSG